MTIVHLTQVLASAGITVAPETISAPADAVPAFGIFSSLKGRYTRGRSARVPVWCHRIANHQSSITSDLRFVIREWRLAIEIANHQSPITNDSRLVMGEWRSAMGARR
jgi:hypothetical protein